MASFSSVVGLIESINFFVAPLQHNTVPFVREPARKPANSLENTSKYASLLRRSLIPAEKQRIPDVTLLYQF
jgi:hypothetical protein